MALLPITNLRVEISLRPANGLKSLSGAPGKGDGGGIPDKVPDGLPPKLLYLTRLYLYLNLLYLTRDV